MEEDAAEEERDVAEVARGEAAGLGGEAIKPFEAGALEKARSLGFRAGEKVEGGADADENAGVELSREFGHEAFLFRRAQADPDEVWLSASDVGAECGGFGGIERAEGRGEGADDGETGEAGDEAVAEFLGEAGRAAEKVVAEVLDATGVAHGEHEIGAVDAGEGFALEKFSDPDERHAVGGGEPGGVENAAECGVVVGFAEPVDAGEADVAGGRA